MQGLEYLHKSAVGSHGNLSSFTCVVEAHWIVKLSDFGLRRVLTGLADSNQIAANPNVANIEREST